MMKRRRIGLACRRWRAAGRRFHGDIVNTERQGRGRGEQLRAIPNRLRGSLERNGRSAISGVDHALSHAVCCERSGQLTRQKRQRSFFPFSVPGWVVRLPVQVRTGRDAEARFNPKPPGCAGVDPVSASVAAAPGISSNPRRRGVQGDKSERCADAVGSSFGI